MAQSAVVLRALLARPVGVSLRSSCTALSVMFAGVAVLLLLSCAVVHDDAARVQAQLVMAALAAAAAVLVLTCWRWMPTWAFFAVHAAVSAALGLTVGAVTSPVAALAVASLFSVLLVESFFVLSWLEAGVELLLGVVALGWGLAQHPEVTAADAVLLVGVLAGICSVSGWLVRAVDRADLDHLTGLPNRRGVRRRGEALSLRARRRGRRVWVALVDLDHFKSVNDTLGHAVGDELLRTVARLAGAAVPTDAVAGRWGGDEFAVLLAADDPAQLLAVVDAVRAALPAGRSLSAGVAPWAAGEDLGVAVQRADQALYDVKRSGRGATRLHDGVLGGAAALLEGAAGAAHRRSGSRTIRATHWSTSSRSVSSSTSGAMPASSSGQRS